jgi:hypothetical protein
MKAFELANFDVHQHSTLQPRYGPYIGGCLALSTCICGLWELLMNGLIHLVPDLTIGLPPSYPDHLSLDILTQIRLLIPPIYMFLDTSLLP